MTEEELAARFFRSKRDDYTGGYTPRPPMRLKPALLIFTLMFIQFLIITFNTLGIAHNNKGLVLITDLIYMTLNFTVIKKVADSESRIEMLGYVLGSSLGAQLAMVIFK